MRLVIVPFLTLASCDSPPEYSSTAQAESSESTEEFSQAPDGVYIECQSLGMMDDIRVNEITNFISHEGKILGYNESDKNAFDRCSAAGAFGDQNCQISYSDGIITSERGEGTFNKPSILRVDVDTLEATKTLFTGGVNAVVRPAQCVRLPYPEIVN